MHDGVKQPCMLIECGYLIGCRGVNSGSCAPLKYGGSCEPAASVRAPRHGAGSQCRRTRCRCCNLRGRLALGQARPHGPQHRPSRCVSTWAAAMLTRRCPDDGGTATRSRVGSTNWFVWSCSDMKSVSTSPLHITKQSKQIGAPELTEHRVNVRVHAEQELARQRGIGAVRHGTLSSHHLCTARFALHSQRRRCFWAVLCSLLQNVQAAAEKHCCCELTVWDGMQRAHDDSNTPGPNPNHAMYRCTSEPVKQRQGKLCAMDWRRSLRAKLTNPQHTDSHFRLMLILCCPGVRREPGPPALLHSQSVLYVNPNMRRTWHLTAGRMKGVVSEPTGT